MSAQIFIDSYPAIRYFTVLVKQSIKRLKCSLLTTAIYEVHQTWKEREKKKYGECRILCIRRCDAGLKKTYYSLRRYGYGLFKQQHFSADVLMSAGVLISAGTARSNSSSFTINHTHTTYGCIAAVWTLLALYANNSTLPEICTHSPRWKSFLGHSRLQSRLLTTRPCHPYP